MLWTNPIRNVCHHSPAARLFTGVVECQWKEKSKKFIRYFEL